MKVFITFLCTIISFFCFAQDLTDFDNLFSSFSDTDPGGAVIVMKNDKLEFQQYFGVSDIQTKKPIDHHTIFNTGSISKTFVAYGILILEESGLLSAEDEIVKYFPDFINKEVVAGIKIKHLLSHASGLPDIRNVRSNEAFYLTAKDRGNFDPIKKVERLKFNPGEKFEYSNPAFNGLALIIEKVSGQKWQDFIKEKIFLPAGMTESYITDGSFPHTGVSHAYVMSAGHWQENDYGEVPTFAASGNGGVWSSIGDLMKYEMAIRKNKFISAKGIKKSREIVKFENWSDTYNSAKIGMSWFVTPKEDPNNTIGKEIIYHTGSQGGFRAFFISIPEEDILYAALFNRPVSNYNTIFDKGLEIIKNNNFFN